MHEIPCRMIGTFGVIAYVTIDVFYLHADPLDIEKVCVVFSKRKWDFILNVNRSWIDLKEIAFCLWVILFILKLNTTVFVCVCS